MGIYRHFPYTNFHEMNLDELLKKMKEVVEEWEHFSVDVIDNIKDDVNDWLDAHPEATTTVQDGSITEAKIYPPFLNSRVWVNVASMVEDYQLNNSNIAQAITDALEKSKYLYVPANTTENENGRYEFEVELTKDCTIIFADDCILSGGNHFTDKAMIKAVNCSVHLYGGTLEIGENTSSHTVIGSMGGAIRLENCTDCSFIGMKSNYTKTKNIIWLRDCQNVIIENCKFNNFLHSAVFLENECKNITIRNNVFTNSHKANDEDYCYFVATGVPNFTDTFTPCSDIIYENNYCENSEDCGLDTHGAKNVIIRNNTVLNSVNAITAYNDNRRAKRPAGWVMDNVLIENNYCVSTKKNPEGTTLPHPFLFIGSSNWLDTPDDTHNQCSASAFVNCVVRNNVFRTNNDYANGAIYLGSVSRNVVFENNDFYFDTDATRLIVFNRCFYFKFINNRSDAFDKNANNRGALIFNQCCGEISGNNSFRYATSNSYIAHIKGLLPEYDNKTSPLLFTGEVVYMSGKTQIVNSYGLRKRSGALTNITEPFSFTVSNGLATIDEAILVPGMALDVTLSGGATTTGFVRDIIDRHHFTLVDGNAAPYADGTYTAVMRVATTIELVS